MAPSNDWITTGLMLALLIGCAGSTAASTEPPASIVAMKAATEGQAIELRALAVPGFLPAVLVVPSGLDPRPWVIAAHGAGGTPEWECDYWARVTMGRAFVLCLRGTRINPQAGFYFRDHHALDAELTAAMAAARRASPRIAHGSGTYAGFSQGATMGSLIIDKHAAELPYAVLIEGFQPWNMSLGRAFARRGGKAVLFACGSRECAQVADSSKRALERTEVRVRAVHAPGAGHTPAGEVEALVAANLPWLWADSPNL